MDFTKVAAATIATFAVTSLVAIAGLVGLQQIGKHNRTTREKFAHAGEKLKRSVLKKVAKSAIKHDIDDIADDALDKISVSYLVTFGNDVIRGIEVVSSSCFENKKQYKRKGSGIPLTQVK